MSAKGFTVKTGTLIILTGMVWGILSHHVRADDSADPPAVLAPEWQQVIGGYGLDKASAGLVLDDGRIMIAGEATADEDTVNADGVVIAMSPDGGILWQQKYGDDTHDTAHGIIAVEHDPQNGFIVIGDRSADGDNLWMLRLGPDGELKWRRDLPDESGEYDRYIFNMPQAEDGGFYAVGKARGREDALHSRGFIIRFDAQGNVLWQRRYGSGQASVLHNVRLLPDGGLLGIGRTNDTVDKHVAAWVVRIGPEGDILWEKTFGDYIFQQLRSAVQVGGAFVISGDVLPDNGHAQRAWVLRIDDKGRVVDDEIFGNGYDQYCYDILAHESGGYVVLCDLDHRRDDQTDAILLRSFTAEGALKQEFMISNSGHDTAFRLFAMPGGDIAGLGTTTSRPRTPGENPMTDAAPDNDIWIFRVSRKKLGL